MSISIIVIALLVFLLGISCWFNFKFAMILIKIEDVLEESLEILDDKYEAISDILERPLFFDSPEVRKVHEDIGICRDSILSIASAITSNVSSNEAREAKIEEEED
jgi:hypothetical protein